MRRRVLPPRLPVIGPDRSAERRKAEPTQAGPRIRLRHACRATGPSAARPRPAASTRSYHRSRRPTVTGTSPGTVRQASPSANTQSRTAAASRAPDPPLRADAQASSTGLRPCRSRHSGPCRRPLPGRFELPARQRALGDARRRCVTGYLGLTLFRATALIRTVWAWTQLWSAPPSRARQFRLAVTAWLLFPNATLMLSVASLESVSAPSTRT